MRIDKVILKFIWKSKVYQDKLGIRWGIHPTCIKIYYKVIVLVQR